MLQKRAHLLSVEIVVPTTLTLKKHDKISWIVFKGYKKNFDSVSDELGEKRLKTLVDRKTAAVIERFWTHNDAQFRFPGLSTGVFLNL